MERAGTAAAAALNTSMKDEVIGSSVSKWIQRTLASHAVLCSAVMWW